MSGSNEFPKGFYRRGLPNAVRRTEPSDDPKAFEKVAVDMMRGSEKTIEENPALGISQSAVDEKTKEFLERGKRGGVKVLENELEKAFRDMTLNEKSIINRLALSLAYLKLTEGVDADNLDRPTENDD